MNTSKIYQVDSFTKESFKGNPAGVMLVDENTTEAWMQQMAAEMNLSETAFMLPLAKGFKIRYFTPVAEVALCGHATLAAAHIVYQLGLVNRNETVFFKAKDTDLQINADGDQLVMDFPRYQLKKIATPDNFATIVGFEPVECYQTDYSWVLAVAKDETQVTKATPQFDAMSKNKFGRLIITAKSNADDIDFVVRCFVPEMGINEDPVTGSVQCALAPLWAEKLGKTQLTSLQVSKRTGLLKADLQGQNVQITGNAVTVFEATLNL